MATYECATCGMAVNATCAKCDSPLADDILTLDDGTEVQVYAAPWSSGKITMNPQILYYVESH